MRIRLLVSDARYKEIEKELLKKIKPALSSKFVLIMSNDMSVDVTRSYYNIFRDSFGI